jgi:hypothetical protein
MQITIYSAYYKIDTPLEIRFGAIPTINPLLWLFKTIFVNTSTSNKGSP